MAEAEVTIDASKGIITVRGEQDFVSAIIEKYKSVFENAPKLPPSGSAPSSSEKSAKPHQQTDGSLDSLDNVYDVVGDTVSILVSPPGNSMAVQARALILLYLYAQFKLGEPSVPSEEIKEQCKAHACFDPKNFGYHLKGQKSLVTVTGTGASTAARLTVPGRKAAEELAKSLQSGG